MKLIKKKGDLSDTLIFVITAFIFGMIMLILMFVIPQISGGLRIAGLNNTAVMENAISSLDSWSGIINYGTFFIFIGLLMGLLTTSFLVRSHQIFLIMYILFMPISIILAVYLGNAYNTVATLPVFATAYGQANMINLFFGNIVKITLVANFLSIIIVFSKFNSFSGGQQY